MPLPIQKMAEKFMLKPESITVGANTRPVEKIRQEIIATDMVSKDNLLKDHLNKIEGSVIIFARTQRRTDRLNYLLSQDGYSVSAIHGGRTQGQRNAAIKGFRSGAYRILVATDIAARGLDIPDISHVINYDIPLLAEDYVHRIGRTGRAGAEGHAISFVIPDEFRLWNRIHKSTAGVPALDKNSAASISTSDNRDKNQGKNKNSNFRSRFNKFRGRSSAKKKEGGWKGGFPSRNSGASSQRSSESHRPKH
jgi:ATP-dependent RNA helicase RhlE